MTSTNRNPLLLAGGLLLFVSAVIYAAQASSSRSTLPMNVPCTVQFRRDQLGMASGVPAPISTDMHNGAQVSLGGTIVRESADSIVLRSGTDEYWIPKDSILYVIRRNVEAKAADKK